jgi:hypothetical protein
MAVKLVLNEVTEMVAGLALDEVVVVDDELLLPQAAINRPPAMMSAATARFRVDTGKSPLAQVCAETQPDPETSIQT